MSPNSSNLTAGLFSVCADISRIGSAMRNRMSVVRRAVLDRDMMTAIRNLELEDGAGLRLKAREKRRGKFLITYESDDLLQRLFVQTKDQNRLILGVNNPVFLHAIFSVKLPLRRQVSLTILSSGRKYFNDQVERARKLLAGHNLIPSFITNKGQIGDHSVIIAEDRAGARDENANRIRFKIQAEFQLEILKDALMGNTGSARHEKFSFDELIAVSIVVRESVQVGDC